MKVLLSVVASRVRWAAGVAVAAAVVASGPVAASPNGVVVSEFQFRGSGGAFDEFVELHNTSGSEVDISGYTLQACAASSGAPYDRASVADGTVLQPGDHYLFANAGGYSGDVVADAEYSTGIADTGGARIVDASGAVVDGVGSSEGAQDACREGAGLDIPTSNGENAFERKQGGTQDTDDNAADFDGPRAEDPQNSSGDAGGGEQEITPIHDIQGPGQESPLEGQDVTIEGVVTGIDDEIGANYERTFPEDAGIFVQEEKSDYDDDPRTSEGLFVGYVRDRNAYEMGDVVRINGEVKEKFGFTMISEAYGQEPQIVGSAPVPGPVTIDPALAENQDPETRDYYETLEGMVVRLEAGTANSGGTNSFGELFLTPGTERDRVFRTEAAPDLIATDADAGAGDPDNPFKPEAPSTTLVKGDLFDQVRGVEGPLGFSFDNYKIMVQPDNPPQVIDGPTEYPYDELRRTRGNQMRVASFNVENYFGPGAQLDLGTVSREEYEEKRDRIVDAIDDLLVRPEVVAVQEVADQQVADDVASHLGNYTAYHVEGNDERGIDVAYLIKDNTRVLDVRQLGKDAPDPTGNSCSDADGLLFDRPPLEIELRRGPLTFTLINNHFASKGNPDACRDAQAAFVADRAKELQSSGREVMVVGDLNAFEDETPLEILQQGGTLDNLWDTAPAEERYSFAYSGRLQTLDHILVTDGIAPRVGDFRYAHFDNDYYDRNDPTDGHKVSDHDPPVVTLSTKPDRGGPKGKPGKPGRH